MPASFPADTTGVIPANAPATAPAQFLRRAGRTSVAAIARRLPRCSPTETGSTIRSPRLVRTRQRRVVEHHRGRICITSASWRGYPSMSCSSPLRRIHPHASSRRSRLALARRRSRLDPFELIGVAGTALSKERMWVRHEGNGSCPVRMRFVVLMRLVRRDPRLPSIYASLIGWAVVGWTADDPPRGHGPRMALNRAYAGGFRSISPLFEGPARHAGRRSQRDLDVTPP